MSKLIQIPEATLAALLREAGRPESVEAYLASGEVKAAVATGAKLLRRANAAYWSRFWLCFSAVVTWLGFVAGPDVEGFIGGVLLTGMTVVEFRVYDFFRAADVRGAIYGWWNQCLFAVLFLIYGLYHGTFVTISPEVSDLVANFNGDGSGGNLLPSVMQMTRVAYYTIGLVGAIGQFWLACYYRLARF
jgi:hypothetical protein